MTCFQWKNCASALPLPISSTHLCFSYWNLSFKFASTFVSPRWVPYETFSNLLSNICIDMSNVFCCSEFCCLNCSYETILWTLLVCNKFSFNSQHMHVDTQFNILLRHWSRDLDLNWNRFFNLTTCKYIGFMGNDTRKCNLNWRFGLNLTFDCHKS